MPTPDSSDPIRSGRSRPNRIGQNDHHAADAAAGLGPLLAGLCVTEVTSWGVLYYAFAILAPNIQADTGWSPAWTTAAFSAALVVAALVGVPTGRLLDARGPRWIMTVGSALAVVAVLVIAWSPNLIVFIVGWLVAGVAMAGVLYQPAFAALTRWYGPRRLQALTAVTLVAGLASTVFAPLTNALNHSLSWRGVYLVLAVGLAVISIPIHALALRRAWPQPVGRVATRASAGRTASRDDHAAAVVRSRPFGFLVAGMALGALAMYAALVNLVPLLIERGLPAIAAAWLLGLGGVGQVAGRLVYRPLITRWSVRGRTMIIYGMVAATTAALATIPGPPAALIAVIVLAGAARGIATLVQATAVPDRWGTAAYGRLSGILAAPITFAGALAPWVGAAMAGLFGGYPPMFAVLAMVATVAVALLAASTPRPMLN